MPRKDTEKYNAYMRKYIRERYHKRRALAIEYLGGICTKCQDTENLEIDHINREEKEINLAKLWNVSEDRFWAEIEKCQLLCHDCHQKKTFKELGHKKAKGVHGRATNYRVHGCRCDKCTEAYKKKRREWNENYKEKRRKNRWLKKLKRERKE